MGKDEKAMIRRIACACILIALLVTYYVPELFQPLALTAIIIAGLVVTITEEWTDRYMSLLAGASVVGLLIAMTIPVPFQWFIDNGIPFGGAVFLTAITIFAMIGSAAYALEMLMRGFWCDFHHGKLPRKKKET